VVRLPGGRRTWLRWSLRELRRRWLVVAATALVLAIGTGVYAGLGAQGDWRRESLAESVRVTNAHDLRVTLSEGAYTREGRLAGAVGGLGLRGAEERLSAPTQVDASQGERTILVPGRIVGLPHDGPRIDRIHLHGGRGLRPADAGTANVVLEQHFAEFHGLPESGRLAVAGRPVRWVGTGVTPDWFLVTSEVGWGGEAGLAVMFAPLRTAQRLTGRSGEVNELVVDLAPGADVAAAERRVRTALAGALPRTGFTVTRLADEPAYGTLYRDAANDQRIFTVYAWLLLLGATFAAFNLISRVVEAQRREIGIGMALGVEPLALALRPLLMGAQIALLGVVFGIGVGLVFASLLAGLMEAEIPLPVWTGLFDPSTFVEAAAFGFALPFIATALAVRRGVRMTPVEAIRVGARAGGRSGLAPLLSRVPLPGRSLDQMPLRNALRAPRRTLLTVAGIGAVLTGLVSLVAMIDSMRATVERSAEQTLGSSPERLDATLEGFVRRDDPRLAALRGAPQVGRAEPGIVVPARAGDIDLSLRLVDSRSAIWRPSLSDGRLAPGARGIVLSERAAEELAVGVGDRVAVRHPRRTGARSFELVTSRLPVAGLHPNPFRFLAYMDAGAASLFALGGAANSLTIEPAPGATQADVQRLLFGQPGIAAVEPASASTDAADDAIDEFLSAIVLTAGIVLILALLVAFNATSINADERRRETATMFAFGVPLRSALRVAVLENVVVGLLATAVGIAGGMLVVRWMVTETLPDTFPELAATATIAPGSLVVVVLAGVGAVAVAPLLTARRLRAMDVPSTLRVVE
jgi:putative ABC transport system permease protein